MLNNHDKFTSKATSAIFMGYSLVQKGCIIFNIQSKTFFVSRDVVFHENIFHFNPDPISPIDPTESSSLTSHSSIAPDESSPLPDTSSSPIDPVVSSPLPGTSSSLIPPIVSSLIPLRKSTRLSKPPSWLSYLIFSTNPSSSISLLTCMYLISCCINYDHLPSTTRQFAISLSSIVEPHSYQMTITDQ
ncbi:hypothetical protein HRI_003966100 [Hibiscus trionum]|uniref:Retroviral polymerase SH3-like domain-containing protein n=1 Tax=Hibiscus trionum TaxID=183268 RepID=A0A9W7J001_HIBTR|nr:hypothetical protein HRI_003966100 [Hibiscus trionum]